MARLGPVSVAGQPIGVRGLTAGWEVASAVPGLRLEARAERDRLAWAPAAVPGTAASAMRAAGLWRPGVAYDFDALDWWFRTSFTADQAADGEEVVLCFDGLATVAEVYLNGSRVLDSESMFARHAVDVGSLLRGNNELVICCRALKPLLAVRRRPRARWRTKLVSEANLRFYRTMLLGRAPSFAPGPAVVGPWRPVRLERRRRLAVDSLSLRARFDGAAGVLSVHAQLRGLAAAAAVSGVDIELTGPDGAVHRGELTVTLTEGRAHVNGTLEVADPELWWPHTHGSPALYSARLLARVADREVAVDAGRVGFRSFEFASDLERDGIQLRCNGVAVFARGAVWTPLDLADPHSSPEPVRAVLETVVGGGMNMLRVAGIGCYESAFFYDLCDELGILVWQDFMFANLDYPESDETFMDAIRDEGRQLLSDLGGRPSVAVLCGGSEVAQQVAMLGLDPELANGPLYGELLPELVSAAGIEAPYVPSTPWGGDLPFRPDRGVANYYGVGAYLRPFEDVRRSAVRFAAESLAFSNVPDAEALEAIDAPGGLVPHHPAWKAGIPRDAGAGWDFEDVRDHYLRTLFDVDPVALRWTDPERYLDLGRVTTGEVMTEVFGEWRRSESPCGGGLVLWLTDLQPGAGWGVLDHRAQPKLAFHHLRRVLAPIAVWSTDEGLGGVVAHVANDRPEPLRATLRVALYRDFELLVAEAHRPIELAGRAECAANVEQVLGWFADVSWAYRFGPPGQNLIVLSLERQGGQRTELLSQAVRMPVGRPQQVLSPERLGLSATFVGGEGETRLALSARRFVYGVRVHVPGFLPDDDGFSLEPGHERLVRLARVSPEAVPEGSLTAINVNGRVTIGSEA